MSTPTNSEGLPPFDAYRRNLAPAATDRVVTLYAHLTRVTDLLSEVEEVATNLHEDARTHPDLIAVELQVRAAHALLTTTLPLLRTDADSLPVTIPCEDCDDTGRVMVADGSVVRCSCPRGRDEWAGEW